MIQEYLEKAYKFLRRIDDIDITFFILDVDEEEKEIIIYSNRQLSGYQPADGLYTRRVSYDNLPEDIKTDLKRLSSYAASIRAGFENSETQEHLLTEILMIEDRFRKYPILPTTRFIETLLGGDDRYKEYLEQMRKANALDIPIDVKLVHEALHGDHGWDLRVDLMRELEKRGYVEPSEWDVVDELVSKLADVLYIEENRPDYLATRESVLREEIEFARSMFSKDATREAELDEQSDEQQRAYIYGRASEIYFQLRANPNFWCYVKMLFSNPPIDDE